MTMAEDLLRKTKNRINALRRQPEATYRLQFHAGFTFKDATAIVPYLSELGVTHCYASPYLQARAGSQHGYDITDHRVLNPEIGTPAEYDAWVNTLHAQQMGQILDMVPNHMGIASNENMWWNDVLENGRSSPYAGYFDIAWDDTARPELNQRVLLPVLGDSYGKVLEAQQLQLVYDAGAFAIDYFGRRFPLSPRSYGMILTRNLESLDKVLGSDSADVHEYRSILTALNHLPNRFETNPEKIAEAQREKEIIKRRLSTLSQKSGSVRDAIEKSMAEFNGKAGDPRSFDLLDKLLDHQAYRLSYWRVAADEINYRRFFDINELAALSMEKRAVFTATHELVLYLLSHDMIDGLRIDHPDGLYDPKKYLLWLQQYYLLDCAKTVFEIDPEYRGQDWQALEPALLEQIQAASFAGQPESLYVVVEKILGPTEDLPPDWITNGTSGYDFLCMVNGLFVDSAGEKLFTSIYRNWFGDDTALAEIVYQKKSLILRDALSSELHMLGRQLDKLAQKNRYSRDFTRDSLRSALAEVIACFPVYRSYISDEGAGETDKKYVETAVRRAIKRNPTTSRSLFRYIRDMLVLRYPDSASETEKADQRSFAGKFQQVTAPVMAKGVEDTSFYVYNRLVSLNEVGGDPARFGSSPASVHHYHQNRQQRWPLALSPLSTHDTKRSEDVRARLNVLSEIPGKWQQCLEHWSRLNEPFRSVVDEGPVPDANEEYLLYQTLIGAWPLQAFSPDGHKDFEKRIQNYMVKALHEAKVHTSWINPNEAYDEAVGQFITSILDESKNGTFLEDIRSFVKRVSHFGMLNSLAQTVLKIASPGVADTYQGTELWDFSLVDPDNRRPVDYRQRREMLRSLKAEAGDPLADRRSLVQSLLATKEDGRIKLYTTWQSLQARKRHRFLFSTGDYIPIEILGDLSENAFGFFRQNKDAQALVVVPRLITRLVKSADDLPLGSAVWGDTRLRLPASPASQPWLNVFTGTTFSTSTDQSELALGEVFADFPVALFIRPLTKTD